MNTVCKTKIVMEQVVQRSKHKVVGGLHVVLIYHHPWSRYIRIDAQRLDASDLMPEIRCPRLDAREIRCPGD